MTEIELVVAKIREEFGTSDAKRDAGLTTPSDIQRFDNICYGKDPVWQSLDLYRPKSMDEKKLPVIVSVHGGAWVYGTKEIYQFYCMRLAQFGFAVVNFNYRLAPEHKFPSSLEDTNLVFQWIEANKETYQLDTDNVFAVGDSAGGHLLGLYAGFATNPEFAKNFAFEYPKSVKLRKIALNCGKYILNKEDYNDPQATALLAALLEKGGAEEEIALIDVTTKVTPNYPETFVMTCPGDFLKNQAILIVKALEQNDVPFEYHFYGNKENPLGHVFHVNQRLPEAEICNKDQTDFFKKGIGE